MKSIAFWLGCPVSTPRGGFKPSPLPWYVVTETYSAEDGYLWDGHEVEPGDPRNRIILDAARSKS